MKNVCTTWVLKRNHSQFIKALVGFSKGRTNYETKRKKTQQTQWKIYGFVASTITVDNSFWHLTTLAINNISLENIINSFILQVYNFVTQKTFKWFLHGIFLTALLNRSISQIPQCACLIPTMHHPEQKCEYFCSEWCIVGCVTGLSWDLWMCFIGYKARQHNIVINWPRVIGLVTALTPRTHYCKSDCIGGSSTDISVL